MTLTHSDQETTSIKPESLQLVKANFTSSHVYIMTDIRPSRQTRSRTALLISSNMVLIEMKFIVCSTNIVFPRVFKMSLYTKRLNPEDVLRWLAGWIWQLLREE